MQKYNFSENNNVFYIKLSYDIYISKITIIAIFQDVLKLWLKIFYPWNVKIKPPKNTEIIFSNKVDLIDWNGAVRLSSSIQDTCN